MPRHERDPNTGFTRCRGEIRLRKTGNRRTLSPKSNVTRSPSGKCRFMKHEKETSSRIAPLDGWRTISVALVIFCHLTTNSNIAITVPGEFGRAIITPILNDLGKLGVGIFFVISGYVITGGLIREYRNNGNISIKNFYLRRVIRIVPPLFLYVMSIVILAQLKLIPESAFSTLNALTFTCNISTVSCGGWFGSHMWSLSYEEQFYLVIPFVFFLLWRSKSSLFFTIPILLLILTLVTFPLNEPVSAYFGHFIAIATGVAWASREQDVFNACQKVNKFAAMAAPLLLVAAGRLESTRYWPLAVLTVPLITTFMLCYSSFISLQISNALSNKQITYFGRISYSIYLWQQLATNRFNDAGVLFYVGSVAACLLLSAASFKWIESPLISIGHSLTRRRSQPIGPEPQSTLN